MTAAKTQPLPLIDANPSLKQTTSPEGGHHYWLGDKGPLPGATSITGLQEAVGGSDGLMNWAVSLAVRTAVATFSETGDAERARLDAWKAKNAARDLGTRVHRLVEDINKDRVAEIDPDIAAYGVQFLLFAKRHKFELTAAEQMVANTTLRFGGSFDIYGLVDGELTVIDVKSGKERASHRLQVTGYTMAEWRGDKDEPAVPMEKVERICLLYLAADSFHADIKTVRKADRDHFAALVAAYHLANDWRLKESAA